VRCALLIVVAAYLAAPAFAQAPELTVTAHSWGIVNPAGELIFRITDQGSNAASSDQFRGPAIDMPGGVIRGPVDFEGGRGTTNPRTSNLNIGAGNGTNHRGILALNPDIGSEIRLMNGHGRTCIRVLIDRTIMFDCRGHRLAQFGPRGVTFYVKPRVRRR
jgi:hypothetical protein